MRTDPTPATQAATGPVSHSSVGGQAVPEPRHAPAVSSRLSALKARLDSEKQRGSGSDMQSDVRYGADGARRQTVMSLLSVNVAVLSSQYLASVTL